MLNPLPKPIVNFTHDLINRGYTTREGLAVELFPDNPRTYGVKITTANIDDHTINGIKELAKWEGLITPFVAIHPILLTGILFLTVTFYVTIPDEDKTQ